MTDTPTTITLPISALAYLLETAGWVGGSMVATTDTERERCIMLASMSHAEAMTCPAQGDAADPAYHAAISLMKARVALRVRTLSNTPETRQ